MELDIFSLAHEVKNPLTVVKGYMEMINSNNVVKYKDIINNELECSINILNGYLEYRKLSLNKEILDINLVFMDIEKKYSAYLESKGVSLTIDIKDDDEVYLLADYDKLLEVFNNVIKNSVEAMAKNIYINYQIEGDRLCIVIENDGLKLNENDFHGIRNDFGNKILGNGIGMIVSKKIMELHKGTLEYFNSKRGVKTIISFFLD